MDNSDFKAVVQASDIVREIEIRGVILKRKGTSYQGLCPFHTEKTPSFSVSPVKEMFKCFGCGKSGDVIDFVAEKEGISLSEAMQKLAAANGVELTPVSSSDEELINDKTMAHNALKIARIHFQSALLDTKSVKRYIFNRGIISVDMIKHWGIGYAMQEYNLPVDFPSLQLAGLKTEKGNFFRDRLMFPIEEISGRIIGFTGRAMGAMNPKYLNTSDTILFSKGSALFGIRQAITYIKASRTVWFAEGVFDVIALHEAGCKNTVSNLGTALTEAQAKLVRKYSDKAVLAYDGDVAGQKASARAIPILLGQDYKSIEIMVLPPGEDPSSMVAKGDDCPDFEFMDWMDFLYSVKAEDTYENISAILSNITFLKSPVRRDLYLRKLADISGISQYSLTEELNYLIYKKL